MTHETNIKSQNTIWRKWWFWVIVVFLILILVIMSGGREVTTRSKKLSSQQQNQAQNRSQYSEQKQEEKEQALHESPAFKLAYLDNHHLTPSPSLVQQFNTVLSSLEKKCTEANKSVIADQLAMGQKLLAKKGDRESLLQIAHSVDESIPDEMSGQVSCAEIIASIVTIVNP